MAVLSSRAARRCGSTGRNAPDREAGRRLRSRRGRSGRADARGGPSEFVADEIANDSIYGLASGGWTSSIRRAITVADTIRAGAVWVNTCRAVSYLAPVGGDKKSGIGRESGQRAIGEYLQTQCVWINLADDAPNPFALR